MAWENNPVCVALGCRYPIIQSAMGWVATAPLVAAVSNAGGFGILAAAVLSVHEADAAISEVKRLTQKPFGVNFHAFQPDAEGIVALMIKHKVAAASYGRAPSGVFLEQFKQAGIICMPTIGALRHAQKAEEMGADIIIAQGGEGGGHTGAVATTILLPQVVDSVKVPVIASGGFYDGRGLAAALMFGAGGISMGTRFLLTQESVVPDKVKQRYIESQAEEIIITKNVDGLPHRVIKNRLIKKIESMTTLRRLVQAVAYAYLYRKQSGTSVFKLLKSAYAMIQDGDTSLAIALMAANAPTLIRRAMIDGDTENSVLPSGQVAGMIDETLSCRDLIENIIRVASTRLHEKGVCYGDRS